MKHIVQFSGGKDSTAMLLMMLEKGMPVDEIIFCDTGKEFPGMYKHIAEVESFIAQYGKTITTLRAAKSFDYWFSEHVKTKGKNKGQKGYGWATMGVRWCTSVLKQDVTEKYLRNITETYISYIGIASDEPKRHAKKSANVIHPLFDWGITEKMALEYCYNKGFTWGGLYEQFKRVSCWCCPLKSLGELRNLQKHYPELWEELKIMDKKAYNQFKAGCSVEDLERRFKMEQAQIEFEF